jgi:CubicO group peptidase (beta-lactamase class C family)
LPELNSPLVLTGWDADGAPLLRPARRPITLRHLLSHTAGFVYPIWNRDMQRYAEYAGQPDVAARRADLPPAPLMFDPGERWEYGINMDWVGRAVEAVSGLDLDAYLREHVFAPLGMRDTGFVLEPSQRSRLVGRHARTGSTSFEVMPFEPPQRPATYNGGGGLYSVGQDYLTFLQALLNGGQLHGARILRSETVDRLGENQVGDLPAGVLTSVDPTRSNDADFFPQMVKKWGLIGMVTPEDAPTGRSAGSVAWAGLANTYFWLDPKKKVAGVMLTQILPFADRTVLRLFAEFERAIYATSDR